MPSVTSVYSWMKDDEDIKKQVMDARQLGAWSYLDEMLELLQTDVEPQKALSLSNDDKIKAIRQFNTNGYNIKKIRSI